MELGTAEQRGNERSMALSEEKALAARMKKDPQVFGEVFDAHFDAIFHYVLHRTARVDLAEEITAQTFFNAMKGLWRFRWSGVPLSAWLYRIATNEVNMYMRRKEKHPFERVDSLENIPAGRGCEPDAELRAAEESVERHKQFRLLHSFIRELKPGDQALIVLRYFENKPYSEISPILKKREGSLRMQAKRALEKLRSRLNNRGINDEEIGRNLVPIVHTEGEGCLFSAKPAEKSS